MSVQVEAPPRFDKASVRRQRTKMSIKRKRITPPNSQQQKNMQANGLYVHSSPPRGNGGHWLRPFDFYHILIKRELIH
ncbi:hypothetical protein C0J52_12079 [Blattella germanica]|nr:hypothetical protein C0J52_12079 [Blattella germanica]